jgi:cyclic pyranopterin phosphate synthase
MKNRNNQEIIPLLKFANSKGLIIRFLELMKMGPLHHTVHEWLYTQDDILQTIQKQHHTVPIPRKDGSTANYWQLDNGQVFGIIANESAPFCSDCNRLRLDTSGKIYGCISNNNGIEVANLESPMQLTLALQKAMDQKQLQRFSGTELSMQAIGG